MVGSLQVLAASEPLHNLLSTTADNVPPEGQLTTPFVGLMRKIYRSQTQQSLNPKELYNTFVKKYTYFKPYTQQDAHEFMRFLLEGLKSEVPAPPVSDTVVRPTMKRTRRRTLVSAGIEEVETQAPNAITETQGTYIDQLFGGKLASYVVCDVCKSVRRQTNCAKNRYRRAMRIFKIFHYRFMMRIHLTCDEKIDFAHGSFVLMPLIPLIRTNILVRRQMCKEVTKKKVVEWRLM
jgi:Ubiquitin carboxyl-terminal hydrolase